MTAGEGEPLRCRYAVDVRDGRIGEVMGAGGGRVQLRPVEGGREWDCPPESLGEASPGEVLRARVRRVNREGRLPGGGGAGCGEGLRELTYNQMVAHQEVAEPTGPDSPTARADRLFQALADATRREIVALTLTDERSVTELAQRFPMSFAAVQKHVAVLERAGLVTKERRGREQRVKGNADALDEVHRLLDRLAEMWRGRVDRIGDLLAGTGPTTAPGSGDGSDPGYDTGSGRGSGRGSALGTSSPDGKEQSHDRDRRPEEH